MNQRFVHILSFQLAVIASSFFLPNVLDAQDDGDVDYSRDVRPLLSRNCYVCHGPDPGSRESGLRLDRADSALSILKSGHSLSEKEIAILRRWIEAGAKFDIHWSFRPLKPTDIPDVQNVAWSSNPIDRFILARLEKRSIAVSSEADKSTLVRRLSLDLLGIPPTPEDVEMFLKDERSGAYDRLVDRLLSSPRFGERWGRHWLDLAHYADSDGYLSDALRPSAWLYRDWVVEAFNLHLSRGWSKPDGPI